jgi:hypothetical protein
MHWLDPEYLPETRGAVTRFLLNPHGELDGLILDRNRQVHFPPHLAKQVARHIAIGDKVTVRGVKPRAADLVAAVSLTAKNGTVILDAGPPPEHGKKPARAHPAQRPMELSGTVQLSLYGPKGELRGALLDDGCALRMPAHAAHELAEYLAPGAHVRAWGQGIKTPHGLTLAVDEIGKLVDA